VCGSCANFDPYIFEEGAPEDPYNPFEMWWKYAKFPLAGGVAALITGCVYGFYTLVDVYVLKFPDFWLKGRTDGCSEEEYNATYQPDEVHSTWGFARGKIYVTLSTAIGATTLLMSLAIRARKRSERNLIDWPVLDVREEVHLRNPTKDNDYSISFVQWPYYFVCQLGRYHGMCWKMNQKIRVHEEIQSANSFKSPKKITRSDAEK
jgi:hypothetical protein